MEGKSLNWFLLDSTPYLSEIIDLINSLQLRLKPINFIFYEGKHDTFAIDHFNKA